ncbi:MAG: hypothetical protein MJ239_05470 [Bacilli bacterium]|nr:hypothetical protein [Bacilli bacterium]
MNWYGFKNTLKFKKNKILAVSFSFFGLALLLTSVIIYVARTGFASFFSDYSNVFNFALLFIVYGILFGCNVKNDNFAYQGILMFAFIMAFDAFVFIIRNANFYAQFFSAKIPLDLIPYIIYFFNFFALTAFGVILYVVTIKYMRGRIENFGRVRLFGILFAVSVLVGCVLYVFSLYHSVSPAFYVLMPYIFEEFSMTAIAISIVFTLERLRRI